MPTATSHNARSTLGTLISVATPACGWLQVTVATP